MSRSLKTKNQDSNLIKINYSCINHLEEKKQMKDQRKKGCLYDEFHIYLYISTYRYI